MRGLWRPVDAVAGGELRWVTNSKYGPTILALVLALVALPFVALSLQVYTLTPGESSADRLVDTWAVGRWTAAASAVIVSALVAGCIEITGSAAGTCLRASLPGSSHFRRSLTGRSSRGRAFPSSDSAWMGASRA